jgi:putative DNA methylase
MNKRFIEWDLPLGDISEGSAREKNIRHGHPSTLHIWWARRPLASSRATNFAALINLPEDKTNRNEITNLIKDISQWESIKDGDNEKIKMARKLIKEHWCDNPPKILDPFSGGGTIPLEALRLGCKTYANDYNPVAVLIGKAILEWPQKFGKMIPHPDKKVGIDGNFQEVNFLAYLVKKWSAIILKQVKEELSEFYPNEPDGSAPIGYIWARTIPCQNPNCGIEIPLIRQFWLAKKTNKKIAYKTVVDVDQKTIKFEILEDYMNDFNPDRGTIAGGTVCCPVCKQTIESKVVRRLSLKGLMGERMIAVVLKKSKKSNKCYRLATDFDKSCFERASSYLDNKVENWAFMENPSPDEKIRTPTNEEVIDASGSFFVHLQPVIYGMSRFEDLFNSRQKLELITFMEKIKSIFGDIKKNCKEIKSIEGEFDCDEVAKAVVGYLGLIMSRHSSYNSNLCWWEPLGERSFNVFGRQALPMVWDYSEQNPFETLTGNWNAQTEITVKIISNINLTSDNEIQIVNHSAENLPFKDDFFDAIFTDPPYYDNIPYADLSDFFYVWLKRAVGDVFPDLFSTPLSPKTQECIENVSLLRRKTKISEKNYDKLSIKNKNSFDTILSKSFIEMYRILKQDGIVTIVYAHKTTAGWETMLNSLVKAGFVVTSSWPIHTEMKTRLRASSSAALASSIYMVCRKSERKKVGFYNELKPMIEQRIEDKLQQFWDEGIAGGDFFISAIGPGMEIFSQYERVEKLSGDQVTTVELLDFIRTVSTDFIVGKLLKNSSSVNIDNESEFYLAYRWTYLDNTVEYDDARKLANASGVNLEKLWITGGFVEKKGSKISVLGPKDRDKFEQSKNMIDVMHKCLQLWEMGEKEKITQLLAETGFGKDPAFKQFCQAIAESLINGNKEKQLLEGFLIGIDAYTRGKAKAPKDQTDLKQFGGS